MSLRRTKIVATIGPASSSKEMLKKMMIAGLNVCRLNFSHGSHDDHKERVQFIRELSEELNREVAILADLQGPKIRISRFKEGKVVLQEGAKFVLDASLDINAGDINTVGIDYKELPKDVGPKDILLLDDGRVVLEVQAVTGPKIDCKVVVGGALSNNKGLNRQGGGLSANVLTDKDKEDLKFAATLDVDYYAVSFVRCAEDIRGTRELIRAAGSDAGIIAKIERVEAVEPDTLDEIIKETDGVMVARGDLGVEIGDAELPAVQKRMITRARELNKPVITATQMMESMIHNEIPTRAEVFDVANAVIDTTDAVMLSAESASGDHPDVVVAAMARICLGAEKIPLTQVAEYRIDHEFDRIDEAIAMSSMYAANHAKVKAIICLTESGYTPLLMSRVRSGIPIFALTRNMRTQRRMCLYRDVYPLAFDPTQCSKDEVNHRAIELLMSHGVAQADDLVIITEGDVHGEHGGTNTMKIYRVKDVSKF